MCLGLEYHRTGDGGKGLAYSPPLETTTWVSLVGTLPRQGSTPRVYRSGGDPEGRGRGSVATDPGVDV